MKSGQKILIVDDKVENLVALEKILAPLDVEAIKANTGNEALALTLEHDFALVLMDVQMPGMDGYETVTLMRQDKKTENLPVIFLSAVYSGQFHKIKGIEVGAVDFIEKPLTIDILRGKVRNFLNLHKYQIMLENFNAALEKQVDEKTEELKAANKKLQLEIEEREQAQKALHEHRDKLEEEVRERTRGQQVVINSMADREIRMIELKETIKKLCKQLEEAGMTPAANLKGIR